MQIILLSIIAGIAGTGLGGLIAASFGKNSSKMTCGFLSFSGGIMTGIVCFGLIPEAMSEHSVYITIGGLILGVLIIMPLHRLVDRLTSLRAPRAQLHETPEELLHEEGILASAGSSSMMRSGLVMLVAIGLHNIPEGLAIGAAGSHDTRLGLMLALMIALHNIPEGMGIAAPLIAGGVGRGKTILLTTLSGAPTILGAAIGMLAGDLPSVVTSIALALAGGAMLYVVFGEIIPEAVTMRKSRSTTIVLLAGIILGLLLNSL